MYFASAGLMNNVTVGFLVQNTIRTLFRTLKIYCSFERKNLLGTSVIMFLKHAANIYSVLLLRSTIAKDKLQNTNALCSTYSNQLLLFNIKCRNNIPFPQSGVCGKIQIMA